MFIYQRVCEIGCWMRGCLRISGAVPGSSQPRPGLWWATAKTSKHGERNTWCRGTLTAVLTEPSLRRKERAYRKIRSCWWKKKVLCSHFCVAASNFLDFRGMTIYSNKRWDSHIFQCLNHVPPSCDCKQISVSPKNIGSSAHCFWIFLDTVVALQSEKSSGPADKLSFHQTGWWGFQRVDCHKLHDIW